MSKEKSDIEVKRETTAPEPALGWGPLASLRDEVDRLFDDFGAGFWRHPVSRGMFGRLPRVAEWQHAPAVEVADCDGEYRLTAELPGMTPENIEIKLTDGQISIKGEKAEDHKEEKEDYIVNERRYGSFYRTLPLPSGVNSEAVSAHFKNGVLTVTMPKSAEAKSKERKIEVKAA